MMVAQQMTLT